MPADDGILPGMAPRVGLWGLAASKPWFHAGEPFASIPPNAGLERQAECVWHGPYQPVACPLEGPVGQQEFGNVADFLTLQLLHSKTKFDQIVSPPRE